ncbi:MAG: rhomboid family intramembrane serine protease [Puniceicoccales bacterium]|jgi:membrane associated rhomboid family serine protease|nr:rhomboid family intramembrane serine protease [Puniceicoccales bacterium]
MQHSFFRAVNYQPQDTLIKKLIWTYGGVFVCMQILNIWFNSHWIENQFSLSFPGLLEGKFWMLFSYSFLHADFFHFLFNGLMLYFLSRFLLIYELTLKSLLILYVCGIVGGGLCWLSIHAHHAHCLMGASAGIMALLTYFCHMYPEKSMSLLVFFVFPVQIKAKWLIHFTWGYEVINGVLYEFQNNTSIANSAHLGGMLCGFTYYLAQKHFEFFREKKEQKIPFKTNYQVHIEDDSMENDRVQRIIPFDVFRKLREGNMSSLSVEEKKWLEQYRKF